MRTLFHGDVHVHYGQIYVESTDDPFYGEHREGQSNGLCGAAVPGTLFLTTGLHTGVVGFTVELHDDPPPVDDAWEEIVEVSFRPAAPDVPLMQWGIGPASSLDLEPVDYRVRYCAIGMDEAHRSGVVSEGDPLVDRYLLQFWPAEPRPDAVLKQTSAQAAYWHEVARKLPPPPPPTPDPKLFADAAAERRAGLIRNLRDVPVTPTRFATIHVPRQEP